MELLATRVLRFDEVRTNYHLKIPFIIMSIVDLLWY